MFVGRIYGGPIVDAGRLGSEGPGVLTTDGFFEWENAEGEQFGLSRLEEVIRASSDFSSDEIIRSIYTSAKEFSGGTERDDDLTAVVLKRSPKYCPFGTDSIKGQAFNAVVKLMRREHVEHTESPRDHRVGFRHQRVHRRLGRLAYRPAPQRYW